MGVADRFGQNLRRARRDADLSQEEVGIRASLHRTEIGLLERGERIPRIDTAIKVATAVNVPLDQLLVGIGWEPGTWADGDFVIGTPVERHRAAMEEAEALRAGQTQEFDAAEAVRQTREDMGRRGGD